MLPLYSPDQRPLSPIELVESGQTMNGPAMFKLPEADENLPVPPAIFAVLPLYSPNPTLPGEKLKTAVGTSYVKLSVQAGYWMQILYDPPLPCPTIGPCPRVTPSLPLSTPWIISPPRLA